MLKKLNFKISSGEKPPKFEYRLQDTVLLLFILNTNRTKPNNSTLTQVIIDKTHGIPLYCEGLLSKMLKEQVITIIDERYEKDNNHGRRDSMGSRVSKFGSFAFGGGANMLKMVEEQSKQVP